MSKVPSTAKTRARKRHRCVNCKVEMPCPEMCAHGLERKGERNRPGSRRLGLCRACIVTFSRDWPRGYPVDDETRALVYFAKSRGVDVRDTLATAAAGRTRSLVELVEKWTVFRARVRAYSYPVTTMREEHDAVAGYVEARAKQVSARQAAAEALSRAPTLKSAGNVRRRASLLLAAKSTK